MQSLIRKSLTRTTCTTLCVLDVGIVLKILRASLILLSLVVDARVMYVYIEGVLRYSVSQKVYLSAVSQEMLYITLLSVHFLWPSSAPHV